MLSFLTATRAPSERTSALQTADAPIVRREAYMFVGHYGVSFAAKKFEPGISLWLLFVAVQWLDVVWAPLVLLGIERVRIVPGITASNPLDLYYMPYTHSLVAAVLWSAAAFLVYRIIARRGTTAAALVLASAVFSHWVLDFVVHRPDLPLYDNAAKVGLGLWNFAALAFVIETALFFGGMYLYLRTEARRRPAVVAFGVFMLAVHAFTFFGAPPSSDRAAAIAALSAYTVFALVIRFLEPATQQATAPQP
jgi:membrane-bound metal-dependent hydrolase YbcI (DUF457 family)